MLLQVAKARYAGSLDQAELCRQLKEIKGDVPTLRARMLLRVAGALAGCREALRSRYRTATR